MLKFNTTEIDGGSLIYGQSQSFPIEVDNPSDQDIVLNVNATSCSCTTGSVSPNPVPRNGKAILKVSFNSSKAGTGDMVKTLKISWFYAGTTYHEIIKLKVNVSRS